MNNKVPENINNECEEKPHFKFYNISKNSNSLYKFPLKNPIGFYA